jgi:hypothetical protein
MFCQRHRRFKVHEVTFLSYSPDQQTVDFEAICCDCLEEIEGERDVIGFISSLSVSDWERISPQPILS